MAGKLLLCFDFDETLTKRHTFAISDLKSVDDMKLPEQSTALIRRALAEGHQVAITTHNHRAVVERGLELLGLSGEGIIIIDTKDVGNSFSEGKRPHIRKAKDVLKQRGLVDTDYTPVLIDDSEQNIKQLTFGQHGLQVWQYDPDADVQPPPAVIDAHLHALSQILDEPARVEDICAEHATFIEGRDPETGLSSNLQRPSNHKAPDSPQGRSGNASGFLRI